MSGAPGRPVPVRRTLAGGATVVVQEAHTTPAVSLNFSIDAGSVCDPAGAPWRQRTSWRASSTAAPRAARPKRSPRPATAAA